MSESNENGIETPDSGDGAVFPPETVKVAAVKMPDPVKPVTPGTVPMQPIPDEVKARMRGVGGPGGPATPFEAARPAPAAALPFQPPPVVPPGPVAPAAVAPAAVAPAAVAPPVAAPQAVAPVQPHGGVQAHHTGPMAKKPPMQLTSPGVLGGAGSFHSHAHLIGAVAPGAAPAAPGGFTGAAAQAVSYAAPAAAPAQPAPGGFAAPPGTPPAVPGSGGYAAPPGTPPAVPNAGPADAVPPPVGSNPDGPSGIMAPPVAPEAAQAAAAPMPAEPAGEVDLAATNSPWSAEKRFEADVLPSANVLNSSAPEAAAAPPAPAPEPSSGSRTLMTILLAIAAIGLVGAIVYFAVAGRGGDDDPASVNVGTEQREYADDPAPSASASAAPAPKPKPRPTFKPKPRPTKKPKGDIYDDL